MFFFKCFFVYTISLSCFKRSIVIIYKSAQLFFYCPRLAISSQEGLYMHRRCIYVLIYALKKSQTNYHSIHYWKFIFPTCYVQSHSLTEINAWISQLFCPETVQNIWPLNINSSRDYYAQDMILEAIPFALTSVITCSINFEILSYWSNAASPCSTLSSLDRSNSLLQKAPGLNKHTSWFSYERWICGW